MVPVIVGYLLGSLPFALVIAWIGAGVDLRRVGSGNLGATNVLRTTGVSLALTVLTLDVAKGAVAAWTGQMVAGEVGAASAACAAVVGHVAPMWLRFRGGKGVATAAGAFAVIAPVATATAVVVFVGVVAATRRVSAGSLSAAGVLPVATWLSGGATFLVASAGAVALLVWWRHRENIARLRAGTEPAIGQR